MSWLEQALVADGVTADGRIVVGETLRELTENANILSLDAVGSVNGSGYVVGETFDIVGGTAISINGVSIVARGVVTAISGDDVTEIKITSCGIYSSLPGTTDVATTNASGIGDDNLLVDLTTQAAQWTADRDTFVDLTTDYEWIASSVKATNAPTIGLDMILSAANDGFQLLTATSFENGNTFLTQPGAPPDNEMFMGCPSEDPVLYASITERRLNFMVTDGTFKQYGGIGLMVPFTNSDANYPFPAICHGQSRSIQAFNTSRSTTNSGIVNLNSYTIAGQLGPVQYRDNVSPSWLGIAFNNNLGAEDQRSQLWPINGGGATGGNYDFNDAPVPAGSAASAANMNPYGSGPGAGTLSELQWFQNSAAATMPQGPAPLGPGGRLSFTGRCHIIATQPGDTQVIGFIDGYEQVHGRGLDAFDEIITFDGRRFLVFNDTNTSDIWRWVAMEKL